MPALIRPHRGASPVIGPGAFVAETAVLIGDCHVSAAHCCEPVRSYL